MKDSPIIEKIPEERRSGVESIKVSYFIDRSKTWKLYEILPKYIMDKIMTILILLNDIKDEVV